MSESSWPQASASPHRDVVRESRLCERAICVADELGVLALDTDEDD
jgi:hypothetical protein